MRTALVLMTILGCDDTASDCRYIATMQQRWTSVELCDAESEKQLGQFTNVSYPVVVAVCQMPDAPVEQATTGLDTPKQTPQTEEQEEENLAQRAIGRVRKILPSTEGVREVLGKPVRMVEDSYSWIARRLSK